MPDEIPPSGPGFGDLDRRYPEKTFYLGRVFSNTTTSYKLVWFLAVQALVERTSQPSLRLKDILTEMAVLAWPPIFQVVGEGRRGKKFLVPLPRHWRAGSVRRGRSIFH